MDRRPYEIVATLGPATSQPSQALELVGAGATALRLNSSHLSPSSLLNWLDGILSVIGRTPVVLDLQGSKWRVGELAPLLLARGSRVELVLPRDGAPLEGIPVPHADFFRAAALSDGRALLDDAKLELRLETTGPESATATVLRPGLLRPRKGITLPATAFRSESLTDADAEVVRLTHGIGTVRYAVSYVKDGAEAARYRGLLGSHVMVSKLERPSAIEDVRAIASVSDSLWLCRGDLGAEMGLREMAEAVYRFAATVGSSRVSVLLAGQVLEHMTEHPEPTRSEVCHLYDALEHGFGGVVLSDETAIGRYPVESVRVAAMWRHGREKG